jgi:hypothetical protein
MFDAHLALVGTNVPAWAALLVEAAIVEFPYAAALNVGKKIQFTIETGLVSEDQIKLCPKP